MLRTTRQFYGSALRVALVSSPTPVATSTRRILSHCMARDFGFTQISSSSHEDDATTTAAITTNVACRATDDAILRKISSVTAAEATAPSTTSEQTDTAASSTSTGATTAASPAVQNLVDQVTGMQQTVDAVVNQINKKKLILLEGYPSTLAQAQTLSAAGEDVQLLMNLQQLWQGESSPSQEAAGDADQQQQQYEKEMEALVEFLGGRRVVTFGINGAVAGGGSSSSEVDDAGRAAAQLLYPKLQAYLAVFLLENAVSAIKK